MHATLSAKEEANTMGSDAAGETAVLLSTSVLVAEALSVETSSAAVVTTEEPAI